METQTQNQNKFELSTWGSCRHKELEIVYPKRIDIQRYTMRRGEGVVNLDIAKIKYENRDSSRNMHRTVEFIDISQPIIIRYHGAESCSKRFEYVYAIEKVDNNIVVKKLDVQEEYENKIVGKFKQTIRREYILYNNTKITVAEDKVDEEVCREKLVLSVKLDGDTVYVNGDTYYIKEALRGMGFRWDPATKSWYMKSENIEEIIEKIRGLGVNVNVQEA